MYLQLFLEDMFNLTIIDVLFQGLLALLPLLCLLLLLSFVHLVNYVVSYFLNFFGVGVAAEELLD